MEGKKQLDVETTKKIVAQHWDNWYVAGLSEFIRAPTLPL